MNAREVCRGRVSRAAISRASAYRMTPIAGAARLPPSPNILITAMVDPFPIPIGLASLRLAT